MNLREASLRSTVVVDGGAVSDAGIGTTQHSTMRFRAAHRLRETSTTLFSIDDGTWVSGDDRSRLDRSAPVIEMGFLSHNHRDNCVDSV